MVLDEPCCHQGCYRSPPNLARYSKASKRPDLDVVTTADRCHPPDARRRGLVAKVGDCAQSPFTRSAILIPSESAMTLSGEIERGESNVTIQIRRQFAPRFVEVDRVPEVPLNILRLQTVSAYSGFPYRL